MENIIYGLGFLLIACILVALILFILIVIIIPYVFDGTMYLKSWIAYNRNRKEFEKWQKQNKN